jgi:hypothetical protein
MNHPSPLARDYLERDIEGALQRVVEGDYPEPTGEYDVSDDWADLVIGHHAAVPSTINL